MRIYGNNPFHIKPSYKHRKTDPSFYYSVEQVKNPALLESVLEKMEQNILHIKAINPTTNIFVIGCFVPKAFRNEEMNMFRNIIITYNAKLKKLCEKHNLYFVDIYNIGKRYNTSAQNFHLNQAGHFALANEMIDYLSSILEGKGEQDFTTILDENAYKIGNAKTVADRIEQNYIDRINNAKKLECHLYDTSDFTIQELNHYKQQIKREYDIADEHNREMNAARKAFQKSLHK